MNPDVTIRRYQEKDAKRLLDICQETAWESYKKDPQKLATVPVNFLDYFLEQEPDHVFVAANEKDEAVGYIECNTEYRHFVKTMKKVYFPRLRKIDKSQVWFERKFLIALFFIRSWPCHLHINLTADYQHRGIGILLIDALITKLKSEGFHKLAICAVERGSTSYRFYRIYGFHEIANYGKGLVSLGITF
jgi:GNAT superfamily N-acetyltransferase